jgi:DNA-binding NarL/FixJ family response regulator
VIRVLLTDDHPVVRAGLRGMLAAEPDIEVAGEAGSGPEAVALTRTGRYDVVLMDLRMPGGDGVAATRQIAEIGRELFISEATVKTHLLRAFGKLGVSGRTAAVTVAIERGLLRPPGQ